MNEPIKPLVHNAQTVARLLITDELGTVIDKPYKLKNGANKFRCMAVFIDGVQEPFKAVWTCPILFRDGTADFYGVLGADPKEEVTINAAPNHERYTELTCWTWTPAAQTPTGNAEIPHYSIGFDYTDIDSLTN